MENNFRVRPGDELVALLDQLLFQLLVVVDLAVVGNPQRPTPIGHRLVARYREVENGKPSMAERQTKRLFSAWRLGSGQPTDLKIRQRACKIVGSELPPSRS